MEKAHKKQNNVRKKGKKRSAPATIATTTNAAQIYSELLYFTFWTDHSLIYFILVMLDLARFFLLSHTFTLLLPRPLSLYFPSTTHSI